MTSDPIREFLERSEDQFFDRKSARIQPRELARHLIAFANADGGTIVLGIEDDGTVTGLRGRAGSSNQLIQAGIDFCDPVVRLQHQLVPYKTAGDDTNHLLVLTVSQSERVHRRTDDKVFLRIGDQSRELNFQERLELLHDKGETHHEAVIAREATLDDLDAGLLDEYRTAVGARVSLEETLVARGLARRLSGGIAITNAGVLLFGKQPTLWLPRAEVRVLRYEGVTAETGPRMNVIKDITVDGPLPTQLREAFHSVDGLLRDTTRLVHGGIFRTTAEYPEFAWQEAITNAIAHRSYSLSGIRTEVRIFDDRLEVESPGKLPGIVRTHNIREVHFSRNPRIVRALTDFGFVRDIGEGVDRMFEEMAGAQLPPPEIRERDYAVIVALRKLLTSEDERPSEETKLTRRVVHVPANIARALNERQVAALRFLRENDQITTADLMGRFPTLSDRTASADLMGLVALKLLHRVGKTRGTYYHSDGISYLLPNEVW